MNHIMRQLARDEKIRAERRAQYATETLAEALAALAVAQARYDTRPSISRAYDIAAATDRVTAARVRGMVEPHLRCAELRAEWTANGGI